MANMTVFTSGGVQYAVKDAGSVHHSEAQQLSDAAKAQARANIDAADAAKLAALSDYVTSMSPLATVGPAAIAGADKAAPLPAEGVTVNIGPVQDLHGYDKPWPAGGGKNKLDSSFCANRTYHGVTSVRNADGSITLTGTPDASTRYWNGSDTLGLTLQAGTYTLTSGIQLEVSSSVKKTGTFTLTEETTFVNALFTGLTVGTAINTTIYPQLEVGSTATSYAPYSNICPIHGWTGVRIDRTGVNVWDEEWETGNISDTTGQNTPTSSQIRSKNYIPIKPNTQYYYCCTGSNNGINWRSRFYDIDKNYIGTGGRLLNNSVFTTPADAFYVRFGTQSTYGGTYQHDISINYPPTDTEYHAYRGETYDIDFPTEAGTVYGGTLDVKNGTLTVDRAGIVLDGSVVGSIDEIVEAEREATHLFQVNASTLRIPVENYNTDYATNLFGTDNARTNTTVIGSYVFNRTLRFRLPESIADTVVAVRAWLADNPLQIVYPLESPVTYQLTPQEIILLRGGNAVFADAGDVTLSYRKDVALLLESLLAGQS